MNLFTVDQSWKERGVAFLLAHPDDEALFRAMMECLC